MESAKFGLSISAVGFITVLDFTTRPPVVTDVFESGCNVGASRPGRRVGFRSLVPGLADDIYRGSIIFVVRAAPLLSNVAPNSKQVKCTLDHCA